MSRVKRDDLRDPDKAPDRWLGKEQGLRQVLHSAIRMTLIGEDPYAIHVLIRAADTVIGDLHKRKNISDPLNYSNYVLPEYQQSFYAVHNETYNFLKHGHLEHDGTIPIHSIVQSNDVVLWMNVARFRNLFGYLTHHMETYAHLIRLVHPHFVIWDTAESAEHFLALREKAKHMTRGEMLEAAAHGLQSDPSFLAERAEDLEDVRRANLTKMKNFEAKDLKHN
jgi:hypothetical protein